MTDTIIKGTGNSRSIKAPANLKQQVTDLDSLLDMLIAGLPCDIGSLNEAGCQQIGDALNKANLLKDATAALYGKPSTAVVDDILAAIRPLITQAQNTASQKARVSVGTYTGTGTESQTINVGFGLKAVLVLRDGIYITVKLNEEQLWGGLAVIGNPVIKYTAEAISITSSSFVVFYDKSRNIFSNASNSKFYYVAIG